MDLPVLWHLKVSNYNEKARWALDYKQVPHVRRAALPGRHQAIAAKLTGGRTFPILILDGEAVGDTTDIIAALERLHPEPALYPADDGLRAEALELEDFFDEQLGAYVRLLVVSELLPYPRVMVSAFAPDLPAPGRLIARAAFPAMRRQIRSQFAIDEDSVTRAHEKLEAAGERFRVQVQPSGYLVGDGFTVADLTLAALIAPAVAPEQFPYPQPQRGHPALAKVRDALGAHGLVDWAREMYRRHRWTSAEVAVQ